MLQSVLLQPCYQEVPARKGFLNGHLFHSETLLEVTENSKFVEVLQLDNCRTLLIAKDEEVDTPESSVDLKMFSWMFS